MYRESALTILGGILSAHFWHKVGEVVSYGVNFVIEPLGVNGNRMFSSKKHARLPMGHLIAELTPEMNSTHYKLVLCSNSGVLRIIEARIMKLPLHSQKIPPHFP